MPIEPVSDHGTVLHAIERLPVYVAWSEGYNFRIVRPTSSVPYGFFSEVTRANCFERIADYKERALKVSAMHLRSKLHNLSN